MTDRTSSQLLAEQPASWLNRQRSIDGDLPIPEVLAKYAERDEKGCLIWPSRPRGDGYAVITVRGKRGYAHRLAWEAANGPIPEGHVVDHMCHNAAAVLGECEGGGRCSHRRCVEPEHLRVVTHGENLLASPLTETYKHSIQTHCKRGHEFNHENTYVSPGSPDSRVCRPCKLMKIAEWKVRMKREAS